MSDAYMDEACSATCLDCYHGMGVDCTILITSDFLDSPNFARISDNPMR